MLEYKYQLEYLREFNNFCVYDNFEQRIILTNDYLHCLKHINKYNNYQMNYSKLTIKPHKYKQWVVEYIYYRGLLPLDSWQLKDIPNYRRNAQLINNLN